MLRQYKVYCHNREKSENLVLKIGFDKFYVVKYFKKSKSNKNIDNNINNKVIIEFA